MKATTKCQKNIKAWILKLSIHLGRCAFLFHVGELVLYIVIDMLCILYGRGSGCGHWLIGRQTVWFMMVGTDWLLAISRAHHLLTRIWKCRKFWGEFKAATTSKETTTSELVFLSSPKRFQQLTQGDILLSLFESNFFGTNSWVGTLLGCRLLFLKIGWAVPFGNFRHRSWPWGCWRPWQTPARSAVQKEVPVMHASILSEDWSFDVDTWQIDP